MVSELTVEFLEGIALDEAPPCEMVQERWHRCGNPSVVRVYMNCGECPKKGYIFLCQHCYDILRSPGSEPEPHCMSCGSYNFTWRVT